MAGNDDGIQRNTRKSLKIMKGWKVRHDKAKRWPNIKQNGFILLLRETCHEKAEHQPSK